jgi:hypothetical protein
MNLQNTALFRTLLAVKRGLQAAWILLVKHGHFRSIVNGAPVAVNGEPLPWFTYPAIEYLNQFNFSDKRVFEYGSGNSSLFWAARTREVVSVESDQQWFNRISLNSPTNLILSLHADKENYVSCITRQEGCFDIIVIDGRWRMSCVDKSIHHLSSEGIIILDNSDRYPKACSLLRERGYFQMDFSGFGPLNGYTWTTSIFIKARSSLQSLYSDACPVGGLNEMASDED